MKRWNHAFKRLQKLFPKEVFLDPTLCYGYSQDKWFASHLPDAVALPKNSASISSIVAFAFREKIPVTARGSGFGYVGGCVPSHGGIVLSLERLNRIKEINSRDFVAVVQPGVLTETLQVAVERQHLFYPPDPASRADCSIGGNIATNAGGPRCLKYGVTRDYVLGLEVVLANGQILKLGSRTHKNKTGFDLARLFVGSEGLLGIVTEATLKLLPLPPYRACLAIGYGSAGAAARTMAAIFAAGFLPCALEIADAYTLRAAEKRTGDRRLSGSNAFLILELDGQKKSVAAEIDQVAKIAASFQPIFIEKALGAAECEKLWQVRREFSLALRDTGLTKLNEDIVVPRGRLEELFEFARRLQKKHRLPVACFGHAGDGNIHVNIMVDLNDRAAARRSERALDDLFKQILAWRGVITGEHGIGLAKKRWWPEALSREARELHQGIKAALDPAGILNPGKFLK